MLRLAGEPRDSGDSTKRIDWRPTTLLAQHLDPVADRPAVEAIWRSLVESAKPSYFLSWPWVENWLATLPGHVRLRLLSIFADGIPVAACFIGRRTIRRAKLVFSRALYLNATGHPQLDDIMIEHNAWLARSPDQWPLARLLEYLPGGWDELFLNAMDSGALAGPRPPWPIKLRINKSTPCPTVSLDRVRAAKDGYLSLLGAETRSQIRRSARIYESRGPLAVDVASDLATGRTIFEELVALHQASWTRRGRPGAFSEPYLLKFHERLIEKRLAHGEIQLVRVRAGQQTVGCLYNFVWDGIVSFYQSGFAHEDDNKLKPGLVCHAEAVRHNAEVGHETYDLLAGAARYKRSLSTSTSELVSVTVQRPRPQFFIEDRLRALRDRWRKLRDDREPIEDSG